MYQNVSQDFLDYINNPSNIGRTVQNKIVIDNVEYLSDKLKTNPKITHEATSFIGGFYSKTCEFEILNLDNDLVLNNKEVTVYKGELINGTTYWIPMGIFKALDPNITNNESSKSIKFKGNDRAILFDTTYESNLDWSTSHTGLEIAQEICTNVGITLETTDFAFASYEFTNKPNFEEETTYREVIGRLAEIGGEIAYISRIGGLRIVGQTQVKYPDGTVGKNLCNVVSSNSIYSSSYGRYTVDDTNHTVTLTGTALFGFKCKVKPNTQYTVQFLVDELWSGAKIQRVREYSAEPTTWNSNFIVQSVNSGFTQNTNPHATFTTTAETEWIVFGIYEEGGNGHVISNWQVEEGTTATSYEPYGKWPVIGKEKRESLTKEPIFGAVNTVALGKADIEDDIIYPETIAEDRITWRIEDNPYADLIREEIIEEVASHIIGMSITPFAINGFIDDFLYDLNDVIQVYDNEGNVFNAVILKYATKNRIKSDVGAETQTEKLVNHDIAGSTKNKIDRVSLQVNHNTQQIELLATKTEELENEIVESSTTILQDAETIIMQALQDYVTTGDFETFQQTVSTQFEQTSESFQFSFNNIITQINEIDGALQEEVNERIKYIRFEDGNIIIGVAGNDLILRQSNDRISFIQGENEVAYFSNNKLYVTDGEFLNSLKIGNFMWKPRANGNLSLVFVGGGS